MAVLQPPCCTSLRETGTAGLREHSASSHAAHLLSANMTLPPPLLHVFLSRHLISSPLLWTVLHSPAGHCLSCTLPTAAIPTALGNAFTFSLHWQRYRWKLRIMYITSLRVTFYLTDKKMHRGCCELYRR